MVLTGVNVGVAKTLAGALPIAMILGLRCLLAVAVLLRCRSGGTGRACRRAGPC